MLKELNGEYEPALINSRQFFKNIPVKNASYLSTPCSKLLLQLDHHWCTADNTNTETLSHVLKYHVSIVSHLCIIHVQCMQITDYYF